ncbi:glycosyltransferase [Mariniphaga sediminis]|jgi:glycogen(starch) synthase|uniref:Glycosyltransferase n=2 Tax=Mariniphaga sediminis TaxID=1628158 RepID=A0A399D6J1_9BACT|nr:glycosyltransferase [Mariniphaga sediminis]RIH66798.1 glycosyltransferase [Mariniphaga sediminis]
MNSPVEREKAGKIEIPSNTILFEIAWEVCNQVGGIYTVIRSKVPSVIEKWGDENYFLIGPYFEDQASAHFDPATDYSTPVGKAVLKMQERGFDVHYGQWIVSGRPHVVLFNPYSVFDKLDEIKHFVWQDYHISLPGQDELMDKVAAFGFQVKEFLRYLCSSGFCSSRVVAHFHEWMAGLPIPGLRKENLDIKIVFTTHATLLGRYLAMNDNRFYDHLPFYNWETEANNFNVRPIVEIERASAHGAHVFTTVSELTGRECTHLLGRTPDLILPNGLNIQRFEALHYVQNQHLQFKEKIHDFVRGHFFQSYSFDLDNTLYFFTSGRYEYHNKGYDLTLEALARLNWRMQQSNSKMTVVAFFITRRPFYTFNPDVLHSKALIEDISRVCEEIKEQVGRRLYTKITSQNGQYEFPDLSEMVDDYLRLKLRRNVQSWRTNQLPKIVTHTIVDDTKDEVLNFLRTANLVNNRHDRVKVVYHPDFISTSNPLFKMDYNQFVRGCHLGIFPSMYEPWGYTPLECLASGLPSITSNLAGFGDYVSRNILDGEKLGMYILDRKSRDFNLTADELADIMMQFVQMTRRERIALRYRSEEASLHFDWSNLGRFYDDAYELVLKR